MPSQDTAGRTIHVGSIVHRHSSARLAIVILMGWTALDFGAFRPVSRAFRAARGTSLALVSIRLSS